MTVDGFIERTNLARSPEELLGLFRGAAANFGYENIICAEICGNDILDLPVLICPDGYSDYYFNAGYDGIDPVLPLAMTARTPFLWNDIVKSVDLSKKQRDFFDDCNTAGLADGVTIPIHGPRGQTTVISLSCRKRNPDAVRFAPQLNVIALHFNWARLRLLKPYTTFQQPIVLSPRERECLRWCKAGKSAWDISQILGISERTAQFHISNAMTKLGASSRIAAVVVAIQRGLLSL